MVNQLRLFNTQTRNVEEFKPLNGQKVGLYTCGPTVYNLAHIGNLRTYLFEDLLQRVLEANGFEVLRVMNITDIEDKIIKNAKEQNLTIEEFTKPFEKAFFEDLDKLNIKHANVYPKATEHVEKMVKYIEVLIQKGFAYIEEDGSVYFDISKFPDYGKLSGLENRTLKTGTRVLSDEYEKENAQDFALWKSVEPSEVGYSSPWGKGRPGWHIECSVMSQEYLGDTFDIHTGGVDNIFPHHENEIAQSEAKTGKKFCNYFLHGEHLLVDGKKMAKSLNNFYTLRDLEEKGFDFLAYRYLILTASYRDKLNFTWESLGSASNALNKLRSEIRAWESPDRFDPNFWQRFLDPANNDLGLPQAVAVMWDLVKSDLPSEIKSATLLKMDEILGLDLAKYVNIPIEVPENIQRLVNERENARVAGDFKKSDELRHEIKKLGFEIEDTPTGPKIKNIH